MGPSRKQVSMNSSKELNLVVCSVMIAPARLLFFYKFRTWLDQVVKIVVHTFAVEESKLPLNRENPDGYWYCAGGFCDIDEAGVYQHLSYADLNFAKCLVSPNIRDDHPRREELVISGKYGVNYVCHNITNRILYATENCDTLIDLDIKTTGYEIVVKSALGVYGQNIDEWRKRKSNCEDNVSSCIPSHQEIDIHQRPNRTRYDEIERIHLRAAGGNVKKANNLTRALDETDKYFYLITKRLINEFDSGLIDEINFDKKMVNACAALFIETIRIVGHAMAEKIYPDCNMDLVFDPKLLEPASAVAARWEAE
jgi:hypothetical protein